MRRLAGGVALLAALGAAPQASAWGWQGHQLTGAIADRLLTANARAHVQAILGGSLTLKDVAPWPDCVRSVKMLHAQLQWTPKPAAAKVCKIFETDAGKAEMVAYAQGNWDRCKDDDPSRACHAKYHFADIVESDLAYDPHRPGANDHDVVHTINAAIARLQGKKVPSPYKITTDRQALFLLAHMVGDLHQPLHVGAVYLRRSDGARLEPTNPPAKITQTQGGNSIMNTPHTDVLHAAWDDIKPKLGVDGTPYEAEARALPAMGGDFHGWASAWATDTIVQSHAPAFRGLDFGPFQKVKVGKKTKQAWTIADKPGDYADGLEAEQRAQVIKGGRHLADLLNALWPDAAPPPAATPKPKKPKPPAGSPV